MKKAAAYHDEKFMKRQPVFYCLSKNATAIAFGPT